MTPKNVSDMGPDVQRPGQPLPTHLWLVDIQKQRD